ncbi:MAG: rhomboid family intramembrane serine protease [Firmicutes bacterium]|nr:rhomboid family intramembrane serine protease [Bacillota bacterium]
MNYFANFACALKQYNIVRQLCDGDELSVNTRFATFLKSRGACPYFIFLVDIRKVVNYRAFVETAVKTLTLNRQSKGTVALFIFLTDKAEEDILEFSNIVTDMDADIIQIRWIAEISTGKLTVKGEQPNEVIGIEQAVKQAFTLDNEEALNLNSLQKSITEKERVNIKDIRITLILFALNFIMFLIAGFSPTVEKLLSLGALCGENIKNGEYYRFFTHMFLHSGATHFFANMISLYIIGSRAEKVFGRVKYILFYIVTGVLASFVSLAFGTENTVSVGASGAICGLLGLITGYSIKTKRSIAGIDFITLIIMAVVSVGSGMLQENIDNFAHVGGLFFGFLLGFLFTKGEGYIDRDREIKQQNGN